MKSIILLLAIMGILFIGVGYVKSNLQCGPDKIQYRYIPRSFENEQTISQPLISTSSMYDMFNKVDSWSNVNGYAAGYFTPNNT